MTWRVDLSYPFAEPAPISQPFGVNPAAYAAFGLPYHNGTDFAVMTGTQLFSCAPGVVVGARDDDSGYGTHLRIACEKDGKKFLMIYGHLSKTFVKLGQKVDEEQFIGLTGNTGNSTGPHLHLEIRPEDPNKPGSYVSSAYAVDPYSMFVAAKNFIEKEPVLYSVIVVPLSGLNVRTGPATMFPSLEHKLYGQSFDVVEEFKSDDGSIWVRHRSSIEKWSCFSMGENVFLKKTSSVVEPPKPAPPKSLEERLVVLEELAKAHGWNIR